MATINHSRVEKELKALCAESQGLKKRPNDVLKAIARNPAAFPTLDKVGVDLSASPSVFIRKAAVTHTKHDYRIVFLHRQEEGRADHVDLIYVFKRKDGYHIGWEWMASMLEG